MQIRWRITPIILGDEVGENDPPQMGNATRPADADIPQTNIGQAMFGPFAGEFPIYNFCMCLTATSFPILTAAVPNSYTFPDYTLDTKLSAMQEAERIAMFQNVGAYDLDGNGTHFPVPTYDPDLSYGEFLQAIGRFLEGAFDPAKASVSTIPQVI